MPAVPVITVTPSDANARISIIIANSDTPGSGNNVYRSTPTEYDGAEIKIAESVAVDGTFLDSNVASGVTYSYRAEAVDSGVGAFSLPGDGSVTLTRLWVHAVTRSATTNISGTAVDLDNLIPQTVDYSRQSSLYLHGGRTVGVVEASGIVDGALRAVVRIKEADVADLTTLETIFDTKRYVCVRDQQGRKVFGTLAILPIVYDATFRDIALEVMRADYSEAID